MFGLARNREVGNGEDNLPSVSPFRVSVCRSDPLYGRSTDLGECSCKPNRCGTVRAIEGRGYGTLVPTENSSYIKLLRKTGNFYFIEVDGAIRYGESYESSVSAPSVFASVLLAKKVSFQ